MKYCTIVPNVISERFQWHLSDVRYNPVDLFCQNPQPLLRHFESRSGHIKDGDIFVVSCRISLGPKTPGFTAAGIFLFFGPFMAGLAATTLLWRGTALDRLWDL